MIIPIYIPIYILIIRLFALAFFPDDCAKPLPLATLNPVFTEKAREFLFGAFHHSPQSPLPFDLLLDSVFSFCWSGLIVPSNWSESHR